MDPSGEGATLAHLDKVCEHGLAWAQSQAHEGAKAKRMPPAEVHPDTKTSGGS